MIYEPPSQVTFAHARSGPVDDLRREHAANAQLLAEAEQHDVDGGRVGVGQLGEIADAHHHFGIRIALADLQIAAQAAGEAEADRLEHRIDSQPHAGRRQLFDRFVESGQRARIVRHDDHFAAPIAGGRRDSSC